MYLTGVLFFGENPWGLGLQSMLAKPLIFLHRHLEEGGPGRPSGEPRALVLCLM